MRKKILKLLIWSVLIFTFLVIIAGTALYLNREKIQRVVISEANKVLAVPIEVSDISVSLRKFPSASLYLTDVYCRGANSREGDTLLYAHELFFEFGLWNVFSSNISIDRISLNHGVVKIIMPESGIPNYHIWKDDSAESESVFALEAVSFDNFDLFIDHGATKFTSSTYVKKMLFSGDFGAEEYLLACNGTLALDTLRVGERKYLENLIAETSFELKGGGLNHYINNGQAVVDDIPVTFAVDILPDIVRVISKGKDLSLADLQTFAETQHLADLKQMQLDGHGQISFDGIFADNESPVIKVNFTTSGSSVKGFKNSRISDLDCEGSYQLSNDRDRIHLNSFSGKGKTGGFKGTLDINDLSNPGITLDLESDLELSEWLIFLPLDTVDDPEGRILVKLHFENRFRSLNKIQPEELKKARMNGSLQLEKIGFRFKNSDKKIENVNGDLSFAGNDLKVKSFFFETGNSDIYLEGTFANVLNFIYFDHQKLRIDTRVKAKELHMEDFLLNGNSSNEEYSLNFANSLDLQLDLAVNKFYFDKFSATDITGQLDVKEGVIKARSITLNADKGSFRANFRIDMRPVTHYNLSAGLTAENVDLHDLFVSFKNFGQDAILAENLYGICDADMEMLALMSPGLDIDPASVDLTADLSVVNGSLKNYEPMAALSRFAEIEELKDVKFDQLRNQVSIRDSKVIIPQMEIKNNIVDMGLSGTHNFDQQINYVIRLKLADVLFSNRKKKNHHSEFDEHLVVMEEKDDPNIYIKMIGSAYDPIISLDKKSLNEAIRNDLKAQKKELREIFSDESKDNTKRNSGIKYDLFGDENNGEK